MFKLPNIENLIRALSSPNPEFKCAVVEPGINCPGMSQNVIFKVTCLTLNILVCLMRLHPKYLKQSIFNS